MFGWGRKKDGFEWHEYVRTTIKLRREDRRARLIDAKDVAADGLKYAGRVGVSAGSSGAVLAWNGLISAIQAVAGGGIAGGQAMARTVERRIAPAVRGMLASGEPLWRLLSSGPMRALVGLISLSALHAAYVRHGGSGFRFETLLIAFAAVAGLAFAARPLFGGRLPSPPALSAAVLKRQLGGLANPRGAAVAAGVAALVVGGFYVSRALPVSVTSLAGMNPFATRIVEGKASVLGGDSLRINGAVVRLAGVEAPEADQKCFGANKKRWACGEAAQAALQQIVKGKTVRCEVSGADAAGRSLGRCLTVNTGTSQDVAETLVRQGAVFAEGGLLASYTSVESEAKAKKVGLWRGEAERPAGYRNKLWEAAAKAAPDGCPIKGQVAGEAKTYVLPWSPDYGTVKVRATRGERWFCSEGEAQAAGWKIATR